jgi:hypothetical protein
MSTDLAWLFSVAFQSKAKPWTLLICTHPVADSYVINEHLFLPDTMGHRELIANSRKESSLK